MLKCWQNVDQVETPLFSTRNWNSSFGFFNNPIFAGNAKLKLCGIDDIVGEATGSEGSSTGICDFLEVIAEDDLDGMREFCDSGCFVS